MKSIVPQVLLLFILIIVSACTHQKNQEPAMPEKVCLVLSVGAAKGLAHVGVIDALKEQGIPIDCIYGNSMGAVVGSLYATAPSADLKSRYKEFVRKYEEVSQKEAAQRGILYGLGAAVLSGGTSVVLGSAIFGANSVAEFDNDRFKGVLDDFFAQAQIQSLPIAFVTSYHQRQGQGMNLVVKQDGNLAEAVSGSANNPFIFKSSKIFKSFNLDGPVDPAADRLAAVPVEDAVRVFHPSKVIIANVTSTPAVYTKTAGVEFTEIMIFLNPGLKALRGVEPEFENAYQAGFQATKEALKQNTINNF